MSAHTPGPWYLSDNLFASNATVLSKSPEMGTHVVTMNINADNWQENAALIAAAPDLLNALYAVANALEWHEDRMEKGQDSGALDLARAAIAKAEGRS